MTRFVWLLTLLGSSVTSVGSADDVVFENSRFRAVLGDDAVWRALTDKATARELCAADKRTALAAVTVSGAVREANSLRRDGDRLVVGFAGCDMRLVFVVDVADEWLALSLASIEGTRPTAATLVRVPVGITARGGSRLNAAWDERTAVCLRGINLQSQGVLSRRPDHTLLSVISQDAPGPRLEGTGAALLVAPPDDLKPRLQRLAVALGMPGNAAGDVASRDLPTVRESYWFLDFGERDVDKVIDYCRRTGFRQVMLGSGSWCSSVGHFTFNTDLYPDGIESLRRTVSRLHEHGVLVGMHTFASKVSKLDAFVTPVPERGFCVDLTATLAGDVSPTDTALRTASDLSQWPGSPVGRQKVWEGHVSKHQEVVIDDEIVRYESIGPEGRWDTFLGCQRGAWGTRTAAHRASADCRHYAVDGCINGYILDQESPLFAETTSRLAEVFNTCGFDMVYFDGSEDVDRRRYDYYAANAHATAMRKFVRRPLIHMGGGFHHGLWHSFTRNATVDQYPGTYLAYVHDGGTIDRWPTCKDHIDRSVRGVMACEDDMTPGELGWFGMGPRQGRYDGLQYDEIEYLMCKSLAYNAPISLQTSFTRLEAHPLTPDILEIIRAYEHTRLAGDVPPDVRESLKPMGRDFLWLPGPLRGADASAGFVEVHRVPTVAGTADVRAFVGAWGDGTVATLWHFAGQDGQLSLAATPLHAFDVRGASVAVAEVDGRSVVPVDERRLVLHFPGTSPEQAAEALAAGRLELRKPAVLWLRGDAFQSQSGRLVKGTDVGVRDAEALGEFVVCNGPIQRNGEAADFCEYRVTIPHKGRWTLWARVRYPTGGDMSFGVALPGEPVMLAGRQVLGNCGVNEARWHWTGQGGGVTSVPPGTPLVFDVDAGEFAFRIYPREGPGTAAGNPRLDCLCLAEDPAYLPTDADARAALKR